MTKHAPEVRIGITKSELGKLQVGLEVIGAGRGSICMSAKAARIYADALKRAADKLEEMSATEASP